MKRLSIIFLLVITIISSQNVIFASYNREVLEEELYQHVENVFKERSRVWNQFLLGQYLSITEIEEDLKQFITEPLLKSDVAMFNEMLKNPGSYEEIADLSIKNLYVIHSGLNKVTLRALVIWDVVEYENEYSEEVEYVVEMEKIKDRWLLRDYQLSQ